ncbi:replication-relaxation family protein [Streptomyces sp. BRA346]|uniref:replication-relaxation family protein n=1 Tax=Streptomyces sp. BRA346 TaxID=2878199 RepID=UPI004063460B
MTSSASAPQAERAGPAPGETLAHRVLAALAQHRVVDTRQLQTLLWTGSRQQLSAILVMLRQEHLIDFITLPTANRLRAWYLTRRGVHATDRWPELRDRSRYPITGKTIASLVAAHTRAVVDTHLTFVRDAREHGDDHGPWDWSPETTHHLADGDLLRADALMYYGAASLRGARAQLQAFVEVDRATENSGKLASKLIKYARFYAHTPPSTARRDAARQQAAAPTWQRWYPVFPRVLFVLSNARPSDYQRRIEDLRGMVAEHPLVARMASKVPLGAAILSDLQEHGPRAPVWTHLAGPPERWRTDKPADRCAWTDL